MALAGAGTGEALAAAGTLLGACAVTVLAAMAGGGADADEATEAAGGAV
jgi:hypothetical protein